MQKTSFFNLTVFRKNLTRFWPVYAFFFLIWALILPGQIDSWRNHWSVDFFQVQTQAASPIMSFGFACLAVVTVFSYLYNSRSVSFFHSLPVRRETLFFTNYISGLSFMVVPTVVIYLWTLLASPGELADAITVWLGKTLILEFFFYSFAVLCAMLTGNLFMMPILYVILNFTASIIEFVIKTAIDAFVYGYEAADYVADPLSPLVCIIKRGADVKYLVAIAIAAVIMVVLSLIMYKKRKLESAGEIIAVPCLREVFKYCFALGSAIILGMILYAILDISNDFSGIKLYFCTLIGGAIGYFAVAMLLKKSLKVSKKAILGFVAFAIAFSALFSCLSFDLFGIETYVPEDFESATVYVSSQIGTLSTEEGTITKELVKELHAKAIAEKPENEYDSTDGSLHIYYYDKDGTRFCERYYRVSINENPDSVYSLLTKIITDKTFIEKNYDWLINGHIKDAYIYGVTGFQMSFTEEEPQVEEIRQALIADLQSGIYSQVFRNTKEYAGGVELYGISKNPTPVNPYGAKREYPVDYSASERFDIIKGSELGKLLDRYILEQ